MQELVTIPKHECRGMLGKGKAWWEGKVCGGRGNLAPSRSRSGNREVENRGGGWPPQHPTK